MGNIFRETNYRREVDAGEKEEGPGTRVKRPQSSGSASQDLVRGGPSSEISNRETSAEKETRERREAEARDMKARVEAERAKRKR